MRPLLIHAFALGVVAATPVETLAQMTPILRSDIRASRAPNYGCDTWDYTHHNVRYTLTRIAGGSPSGNDSLRFVGIPNNGLGDSGWGCRFAASLENTPPQGAIRYARWRIKYVSPINWRSDSNASGTYTANNRTAPDKLFILGNTCESSPHMPTRVILWQYAAPPARNTPLMNLTQNIGPGTNFFQVPVDVWLNVQIKIVSSSSTSSTDGALHVYINNNNESRPTVSGTGIHIKTAGWGRNTCAGSNVVWGDGSYNPLSDDDPTTRNVTELADFEYDDQFDPNWAIGVGPGQPSTPTNLNVVRTP